MGRSTRMESRLSDSSDSEFEERRPCFNRQSNQELEINMRKRTHQDSLLENNSHAYSKKVRLAEASNTEFDSDKEENDQTDVEDRRKEVPIKKTIESGENVGNKGLRMMAQMGYAEGVGLGKHGQGRLEPVEASKQLGYRGLGFNIPGLEKASFKWDPSKEIVSVKEEMEWLENVHSAPPTAKEMNNWIGLGPSKLIIDDETTFCDPEVIQSILTAKTVFDNLPKNELRVARTKSNPYELIRSVFFLNRAAVKMANMDKACNFMFTNPKLEDNELLYFADVCAGPGGFSEYVLWRRKWHAKGFGFTLKAENDFKLDDFRAGPCETFHPFYGPRKDGNVYYPDNQEAFRQMIMEQTGRKGVHFMMADGGFSVESQENIQEILSKQLYLCQCLMALMIVRNGGHFVTKLFDIFTPFSAGLVYLMYRCFDQICIFKPNTSRPANSERYLICKGKRSNITNVIKYLANANLLLLNKKKSNDDVMQLVPLDELEAEDKFVSYLRASNNSLGWKQVTNLHKIAAFCQDPTLIETKQADMRAECLKYWGLPDKNRTLSNNVTPQERLKNCIASSTFSFLTNKATELNKENVTDTILNTPYDWFYMPCTSDKDGDENTVASFYMSMGRSKVFRFVRGNWMNVSTSCEKLDLPPDTLIYAEIVMEMRGEARQQMRTSTIHILDAYLLGGEDISHKYLLDRHRLVIKFCKALWKPDYSEYIQVHAKDLYSLDQDLEAKLYPNLKMHTQKKGNHALTYVLSRTSTDCKDENKPRYFIPNSILFLKGTAAPWARYLSRTQNQPYFFNNKTNFKSFEIPDGAAASFNETFSKRVVWYWPPKDSISMEELPQLVRKKCSPPSSLSS